MGLVLQNACTILTAEVPGYRFQEQPWFLFTFPSLYPIHVSSKTDNSYLYICASEHLKGSSRERVCKSSQSCYTLLTHKGKLEHLMCSHIYCTMHINLHCLFTISQIFIEMRLDAFVSFCQCPFDVYLLCWASICSNIHRDETRHWISICRCLFGGDAKHMRLNHSCGGLDISFWKDSFGFSLETCYLILMWWLDNWILDIKWLDDWISIEDSSKKSQVTTLWRLPMELN